MSLTEPLVSPRQLRRQIRRRRQSLGKRRQREAARGLYLLLRKQPWFRRAQRIAFYVASEHEGEIDPSLLLRHALREGKHCYLPLMRRDGPDSLLFVRYRRGETLRRGRFGVLQPVFHPYRTLSARALDLVLVPLVVFDPSGNRMGMGKGFYDRTFTFKRRRAGGRPCLVGVAHECQKVDALQPAPWDVPLQGVATPRRLYGKLAERGGKPQRL